MPSPRRPPPYKDMLLVAGALLVILGVGNWVVGALRAVPHAEYLRLHPAVKEAGDAFESELLEPPDDDREERDVARAKLEFYQLVQSGGRFMVVLGGVCLVAGWVARRAPRYPDLLPSGGRAGPSAPPD
jgi:hypothetical protein